MEYGATAHVEVDTFVGFASLEAAQKLQDDYLLCAAFRLQVGIYPVVPGQYNSLNLDI